MSIPKNRATSSSLSKILPTKPVQHGRKEKAQVLVLKGEKDEEKKGRPGGNSQPRGCGGGKRGDVRTRLAVVL